MSEKYRLTLQDGLAVVQTPRRDFDDVAKDLGGYWDMKDRTWNFNVGQRADIERALSEMYDLNDENFVVEVIRGDCDEALDEVHAALGHTFTPAVEEDKLHERSEKRRRLVAMAERRPGTDAYKRRIEREERLFLGRLF